MGNILLIVIILLLLIFIVGGYNMRKAMNKYGREKNRGK